MNKLTEQIEERYGSFELSHEKNILTVRSIEEFVGKVASKFAQWQNSQRDFDGEFGGAFDEMSWEELFTYFKENVYGKD